MPAASPEPLCLITSDGSPLHRLAGGQAPTRWQTLVLVYLASAAITYLPLLIAARQGPLPLWGPADTSTVTFLHDWGLSYVLLVSLPTLVLLLITDEYVLCHSLAQVQADGVIALPEGVAKNLNDAWRKKFRWWNVGGQLLAVVTGIWLARATLRFYIRHPSNTWIIPAGGPYAASYVYAVCIGLVYAVIIYYVLRCITISRYLGAIVHEGPLRLLPFHPDRCGGLRPVGQLGLRNQYALSLLGLNIVLLVLVWVVFMQKVAWLRPLLISATVAYLVLGPLVFMAPLLPFRTGMMRAKEAWTREIAQLIRAEFGQLRDRIRATKLSDTDEQSIERLRKIGAVIDELPVWPFDARTLRKFATAYVVPVALPVLGKLARTLLGVLW